MSETYGGVDVFHEKVYVHDDGDNVPAFSFGAQQLADRTYSLEQARLARAALATLRAIDTTSLPDGTVRRVARMGLFVLDKVSTAASDEPWVVVPTTGGGRWMGCIPHATSALKIVPGTVIAGATTAEVQVVNRNIAVDFVPYTSTLVSLFQDGAAVTGFSPLVDASYGFVFPITAYVIDGARLVSVRVHYSPQTDHFALPSPAAFGVRRVHRQPTATVDALLSTNNGLVNDPVSISDPNATVTQANAARDYTWVANQNNIIDLAAYTYDIVAFNEYGVGGRGGCGWVSFELTFAGKIPPRALGT